MSINYGGGGFRTPGPSWLRHCIIHFETRPGYVTDIIRHFETRYFFFFSENNCKSRIHILISVRFTVLLLSQKIIV